MWIPGPSGYVLTISHIFNEAFEDHVEGCDDEQFDIIDLTRSLELIRFCFNITSVGSLNLIFQDFLDFENFCRYICHKEHRD